MLSGDRLRAMTAAACRMLVLVGLVVLDELVSFAVEMSLDGVVLDILGRVIDDESIRFVVV